MEGRAHPASAVSPTLKWRRRQVSTAIILVNESREVRHRGGRFFVVGTGDPAGRGFPDSGAAPDIDRALRGIPDGQMVIALAHNPALFTPLAERGVALTLSGHTHWGQLALPAAGWSMASMFLEDAMGVIVRDRSLLYISPGTGYWGIPFRIGATGEITHITLRRGTGETPHATITGRRTIAR